MAFIVHLYVQCIYTQSIVFTKFTCLACMHKSICNAASSSSGILLFYISSGDFYSCHKIYKYGIVMSQYLKTQLCNLYEVYTHWAVNIQTSLYFVMPQQFISMENFCYSKLWMRIITFSHLIFVEHVNSLGYKMKISGERKQDRVRNWDDDSIF